MNTVKRQRRQCETTKKDIGDDLKALQHLPDLVVDKIVRNLPTIPVVSLSLLSKQWQGLYLSSIPVLDFYEGCNNLNKLRHRKFINSLVGCLNYLRDRDKRIIHRCRVHMTMYSHKDDAKVVDNCLRSALMRGAKELDISLRSSQCGGSKYYSLSLKELAPRAKFITTLKLECVSLDQQCISSLTEQWCPFIESLSLTSCRYGSTELSVLSSSLKSLEVMHCNKHVKMSSVKIEAMDLESFTFVSDQDDLDLGMSLVGCRHLRYLNINAHYLRSLSLLEGKWQDTVKATINTSNRLQITLDGYLSSLLNISLEAPNVLEARIQLLDSSPTLNFSWEHYSSLRDFLEKFGSSEKITLFPRGLASALIFPEHFRMSSSPPALPGVKEIEVHRSFVSDARDSYLRDSVSWMAPAASIEMKNW